MPQQTRDNAQHTLYNIQEESVLLVTLSGLRHHFGVIQGRFGAHFGVFGGWFGVSEGEPGGHLGFPGVLGEHVGGRFAPRWFFENFWRPKAPHMEPSWVQVGGKLGPSWDF